MLTTERTLILLKPDTLERNLCGEILSRFERAGMRIAAIQRVKISKALVAAHYAELREKNAGAYNRTAPFLIGREVIAVVFDGVNAIAKARALAGPTDPLVAPAGTIRGDYSCDSIKAANGDERFLSNLVHASDSAPSAKREIRLWFPRR
ncbi:MAG: nucleoside-diphosphate kinase [Verrucomicrobiota bacterium]|jgi:nucleoside-diphosphate kinase